MDWNKFILIWRYHLYESNEGALCEQSLMKKEIPETFKWSHYLILDTVLVSIISTTKHLRPNVHRTFVLLFYSGTCSRNFETDLWHTPLPLIKPLIAIFVIKSSFESVG